MFFVCVLFVLYLCFLLLLFISLYYLFFIHYIFYFPLLLSLLFIFAFIFTFAFAFTFSFVFALAFASVSSYNLLYCFLYILHSMLYVVWVLPVPSCRRTLSSFQILIFQSADACSSHSNQKAASREAAFQPKLGLPGFP